VKKLPIPAQLFVVALVTAGATLLVLFAEWPAMSRWPEFAVLLLLAIATSALKLPLPTTKNRATMSASFVIDFTSLLVFGPHPTVLIASAGALSQSLLGGARRNPPHRTLFNMACFVVTIEASGVVYGLFGGAPGVLQWPGEATPLLSAVIAYFLVNSGLIAMVVSLSTGQPVGRVWRQNFLWSGPNYFIGAAAAAIFASVMVNRLWGFVPLAAVPVYLTHRAYQVYAGRLADEHRHRQVIESLNEGMAGIDGAGLVTVWNDALERIMDCDRVRALGRPLIEVVPTLSATELPAAIETALRTGDPQTLNQFILTRGRTQRVLQVRVFPFVGGATVFFNDITERSAAEQALKRSEERYALAAAGANDGLWDWDLASGEVYYSLRWRMIVGSSATASISRVEEWFSRVHPDDVGSLDQALKAHIRGATEQFQHEHRVVFEDGSHRWVLCRGAAVRNASGRATRIAGSLTDVTERATSQEQLRQAALHDGLTGLPNRRLFTELLRQTLERSRQYPVRQCGVLFLDLDRFKIVNDSLGHLAGDELLVIVSERLRSCLRNGDVLARLGGDEFTILLSELHSVNQACAITARIQEAIQAPMSIDGREVFVSASIGIAINDGDYSRPEDIMRDADTAMYRAKVRGKARHELFDADMRAEALDRLGFETDLRRAIDRNELALHYQPIVSLNSGSWTGFEALLRWERGGRPISPSRFIPVAEETGIIEPLGAWVLNEACRQFSEWQQRFPAMSPAGITVNVSAQQLVQPSFVGVVEDALRTAHIARGALRLEITETSLMIKPELVAAILRELRRLGVNIYLDDFGTGFSSLSHLHRLPVDALKIDRSFMDSLLHSDRPAIVESILALARTLGTSVIAEGVETAGQLRELTRLGCGHAQGYLFSAPLPPAAAERSLRDPSRRVSTGTYLDPVSADAAPRPVSRRARGGSSDLVLVSSLDC
jgi:diguanylate cyclase (GGDEF)-like protein/PAS domain S-box-containing protein